MKCVLLSCFLAGTAGAQLTTGAITQTGNYQVAGVIGNPSIVCSGIPPDVVRALNKYFESELRGKDTQIQKLTKDANQWKDRYLDLASRASQPALDATQKSEADTLLRQGKLDEASLLLASIDKKLDTLSAKLDCSEATTETFALAIKALDASRVLTLWHCRPEDTISGNVQTSYVLLFTSGQFPVAKPFLDQLITSGFNPLKYVKPIAGPLADPSATGVLLARYFYAPVYRPLIDGNVDAIQWIIDHAPSGYWNTYGHLMEDIASIMQLPYTRFPLVNATQAITMLRNAGVPADTHDCKPFRDAYKKWLETQLPGALRVPLVRPTGVAAIYARQIRSMYPSTQQSPQYAGVWKAVSNALAPASPDALHKAKGQVAAEITSSDVNSLDQNIKLLKKQIEHGIWWRKLPETQETIYEARKRQNLDAFDSYGYVQVASGDLKDTDLLPSSTRAPVGYPNCDCFTAQDLRDQLAKASQRKELLLQFQTTYSQGHSLLAVKASAVTLPFLNQTGH
ncbi:hypothetical protein RBB77_13160 [Tunturibacter psychrotolerans]|uniref:Uncharacterized protein n=1 Tax=Tunturiibacter psychrotolerans TaxID=3069686 RepID=A0AAU7ZK72_9BACT